MEDLSPDARGIERAVELLRAGQVIGFPTDTTYGIAARADDTAAMARVYALKERPVDKPLVLMVASAPELTNWASVDERAWSFVERWWPGPLTLILPARHWLGAPLISGDPPTVAVRIPDHPVALALLRRSGEALATTSANPSGLPEALTPSEVASLLPGLAAVIDGGRAPGGIPSTILDLTGPEPRILRQGPIPAADLLPARP